MLNTYQRRSPLLAEQIVNTRDTTRPEPEYLRAPADLVGYLERWNIPVGHAPNARDLADVLLLRERLRAVFEARDLSSAVQVLNGLLDGTWVRPRVGLQPDGRLAVNLAVAEDVPMARRLGVEAALGLSAALAQHGLERFHVCNAVPCTDVFVDTSRNHTRRYCCEQCANRHNVASYRQRQRTA